MAATPPRRHAATPPPKKVTVQHSRFMQAFFGTILIGLCGSIGVNSAPRGPTYKIGDSALPIEPVTWLQGDPVTKYEPGRVYVIEFWATWCPPCLKTIPHLSDLQKKYAATLTVVGINADGLLGYEGKVDKVRGFMDQHGKDMHYTVAMEDLTHRHLSKAWITASGSLGVPVAFIIDRHAKLAWVGYPDLVQSYPFDRALADVIAGIANPGKARALQAATSQESNKLIEAGQTP